MAELRNLRFERRHISWLLSVESGDLTFPFCRWTWRIVQPGMVGSIEPKWYSVRSGNVLRKFVKMLPAVMQDIMRLYWKPPPVRKEVGKR